MKNIENYNGINYSRPEVFLLNDSGIGVAEVAARSCYDSFENSGNEYIKGFKNIESQDMYNFIKDDIIGIDESGLLHDLAWAHQHHSILEHTNISYFIRGTSRGVLQEHARHRIQAISVKSTRYTMSEILYAFIAGLKDSENPLEFFTDKILALDMFVTTDKEYSKIEIISMWHKLFYHFDSLEDSDTNFFELCLSKENIENHKNISDPEELYQAFRAGKKKRNAGDSFKHLVTDNWKVDLVVTFNLRSLKNYFSLRDSGAAWFQIQWLAEEMKKATPVKYLKLIDKKFKD